MAEGKWITDLTADTSVAAAARHALAVRLGAVHHHLPLAIREAHKDPEHVHQLRVATRRAAAALDIFSPCLPDRAYRIARKQLRRIRRAAGAARDWDVFLQALGHWLQPRKTSLRPGLDFLSGYAVMQRVAAQEQLDCMRDEYPFAFERFMAETIAAVRRPRGHAALASLLDLARPMLAGLIKELDQAVAQNLDDYEQLHQVRIIGKRLRYAMEVFANCFAPAFQEELYPQVERMQEILGEANDSHVAQQRLGAIRAQIQTFRPADWKRHRPVIDDMIRHHQERLPDLKDQFREWWQQWQASGGEARLHALLKEPQDPPPADQGMRPAGVVAADDGVTEGAASDGSVSGDGATTPGTGGATETAGPPGTITPSGGGATG